MTEPARRRSPRNGADPAAKRRSHTHRRTSARLEAQRHTTGNCRASGDPHSSQNFDALVVLSLTSRDRPTPAPRRSKGSESLSTITKPNNTHTHSTDRRGATTPPIQRKQQSARTLVRQLLRAELDSDGNRGAGAHRAFVLADKHSLASTTERKATVRRRAGSDAIGGLPHTDHDDTSALAIAYVSTTPVAPASGSATRQLPYDPQIRLRGRSQSPR